ncbi:MAG: hypothetical protein A2381_07230 [Bdellovibrionales bacterium RIFOXYB1_FULL_37_110]|nr:MAG: hypothetical protein A2181_06650 [Bdellovibrionales bacterium RIFOXYA1_FULL_38_20]OFZ45481.1 MAG: hypothetical protein A2417_18130 [Bdellovibrionales bacterium RIFOXYC1_FULL_37_79]OFZ60628.1 MAG: hypothetical protein A2381_07230 [Bdellovibrionales bacterium RIFOXYB1_FULL_37_110]OFZ63456.1 MAG: hypothetical protein A2577_06205 [Bdellovibrionales bacterium RIFOXYD1_FULL_36_51]
MKFFFTTFNLFIFLTLISCGNNKNISIEGIDGPYILLSDQTLIMTMTFKNIKQESEASYKLPQFQNAYVEIGPSNNQELSITYRFNILELIEFDDGKLPLINLPDERGIPGMVGGSLPGIDFAINNFEYSSLYLSANHLGFFIPVASFEKFYSMTSFDYFINNKKAGSITMIGKEQNHHIPGILLLLDFDQDVKDDLLTYFSSR